LIVVPVDNPRMPFEWTACGCRHIPDPDVDSRDSVSALDQSDTDKGCLKLRDSRPPAASAYAPAVEFTDFNVDPFVSGPVFRPTDSKKQSRYQVAAGVTGISEVFICIEAAKEGPF
jgi:hypothetical protein